MQRFESIEIRNLAVRERGFNVEAMVAELLAIVPSGDLVGLYQVALLDSRSQKDRTRWVGVYSNRDGRHALIELYLDAVFGEKVSRFDHALGNAVSRVRLAQTLYHQIGVHRAKMRGERGALQGRWFAGSLPNVHRRPRCSPHKCRRADKQAIPALLGATP